jgi:hypothetical protein
MYLPWLLLLQGAAPSLWLDRKVMGGGYAEVT